jgi:hypothetical protein
LLGTGRAPIAGKTRQREAEYNPPLRPSHYHAQTKSW